MSGSTLVLTHRNADLDGVASAVIAYLYLRSKLNSNVHIAVPEGFARPVAEFMQRAGISLRDVTILESASQLSEQIRNVILLDVSSIAQVGDFSQIVENAEQVVLIDHHSVQEFPVKGTLHKFVDTSATSTCEVLLCGLEEEFLAQLPPEYATLAIAAIIVDSKKFSRATPRTFLLLARLLERAHIGYEQINQALFQREMPFDEKMARIKGMLRTQAYRYDDKIVCVSHVSAHEASLARLLLEAGCDIVIIASEHDTEFRVIARTKLDDVSMAELCKKLAEKLGGHGGGHAKAGAAAIRPAEEKRLDLKRLMRESVNVLSEMLGKKLRRVRP